MPPKKGPIYINITTLTVVKIFLVFILFYFLFLVRDILAILFVSLIFAGLSILQVEYALVLALIAGLTEFVPYLGPILASIPAIFLAFTQSPMLALFVAVLYYIIQLVENNIIVPKLMQKVVGLNPIVSIAVLLIGFKIAGVVGAILSIPVATAVNVFAQDVFSKSSKDFR